MTEDAIVERGQELIKRGAQQVIVSLEDEGSIYFSPEQIIKVSSVKGTVVNTACAGDALLAMFIKKMDDGVQVDEALMYASATGASTAFSKGLSDLADVNELTSRITVYHDPLSEKRRA